VVLDEENNVINDNGTGDFTLNKTNTAAHIDNMDINGELALAAIEGPDSEGEEAKAFATSQVNITSQLSGSRKRVSWEMDHSPPAPVNNAAPPQSSSSQPPISPKTYTVSSQGHYSVLPEPTLKSMTPPYPTGPFVFATFQDPPVGSSSPNKHTPRNTPTSHSMLAQFISLMSCVMVSNLPSMEAFCSHDNITGDYALQCNFFCFDEPFTRTEALRQPDAHLWQEAMEEEALWCYNSTWIVVPSQSWMNLLTSK
jgi:hypothetical protein